MFSYFEAEHEIEAFVQNDWFGEIMGDEAIGADLQLTAIDVVTIDAANRLDSVGGKRREPSPKAASDVHNASDWDQVQNQGNNLLGGGTRAFPLTAVKVR